MEERYNTFIGIDPGFKGAISVIEIKFMLDDGAVQSQVKTAIADAPVKKNKNGKVEMDLEGMYSLASRFADRPSIAAIEDVHVMPKEGVSSGGRFMKGVGQWEGILTGLKIPFIRVAPQTWKKRFNLIKKPKTMSRTVASEIHPYCTKDLSRVKDDGRAESLLIATWLVEKSKENLQGKLIGGGMAI